MIIIKWVKISMHLSFVVREGQPVSNEGIHLLSGGDQQMWIAINHICYVEFIIYYVDDEVS